MDLKGYLLTASASLNANPLSFQLSSIPSLYAGFENPLVSNLYATIHIKVNRAFELLNRAIIIVYGEDDAPQSKGGYFHADKCRDLLDTLEKVEDIRRNLNSTDYAFRFVDSYENHIKLCRKHVNYYRGTQLPDGFPKLEILHTTPAIYQTSTIRIASGSTTHRLPLSEIGSGSYATVYRYKDPTYNKSFAVKRANTNLTKEEVERFQREYRVLKDLSSPYIVEVYSWRDEPMEYTMELLDETIYHHISSGNSTDLQSKKRLIFQALAAFEYIHGKNLLHRDISLTNVMLKHYEDVSIVKVTDFGLVKTTRSHLTRSGTEIKGSLIDPELYVKGFKNYSLHHEIYSLTLLSFFILTGNITTEKSMSESLKSFYDSGTTPVPQSRIKSIQDIRKAVESIKEYDL